MLHWSDAEAALFSLKAYLAGMLAYWAALEIGLERPYWAVITAYFIAQPLAGAVLSKALYRVIGTLLGGAAAVVMVPVFINEPIALSIAMGFWVGFCIYVSLLDRTPRSYAFLLAGFTASIIVFPVVGDPGTVFDVASVRVQEILIGIVAASLVHGLVLPRTVTAVMIGKARAVVGDAEKWSAGALSGGLDAELDARRRRLATDINDLHQLSTHLPFDPARLAPPVRAIRALQDRLTLTLPLATAIEDRLAGLAACPQGVPKQLSDVLKAISGWLSAGGAANAAAPLLTMVSDAEAEIEVGVAWNDMLALSALGRLAEMIEVHRDARQLLAYIEAGPGMSAAPAVAELLRRAGNRRFHVDHIVAARAASAGLIVTVLACFWWIATAWPDGATVALFGGVMTSFFAGVDDKVGSMLQFLRGGLAGLLFGAIYIIAILPRVDGFLMLAAVLAPPFILFGSMLGKPPHIKSGLGGVAALINFTGLGEAYNGDFAAFANGAVAFIFSILLAVVVVALMGRLGTSYQIARLLAAGFRDVVRRARGQAPDRDLWSSRMLDRVGLLIPLEAQTEKRSVWTVADALVDLRVGVVAGEFQQLTAASEGEERGAACDVLEKLAGHFGSLDPARLREPAPDLLGSIDRAIVLYAADEAAERRRRGLSLLAGLRRNLFPTAPAVSVPLPSAV